MSVHIYIYIYIYVTGPPGRPPWSASGPAPRTRPTAFGSNIIRIYIYIYIERERDLYTCIYIYICCICVCQYGLLGERPRPGVVLCSLIRPTAFGRNIMFIDINANKKKTK